MQTIYPITKTQYAIVKHAQQHVVTAYTHIMASHDVEGGTIVAVSMTPDGPTVTVETPDSAPGPTDP